MNCIEVEKLLPLYVGGDVVDREANRLRAHLSSCHACSQLAEEFRASQERLHNFSVPEFGAEFYAQVRGAVLAEINSRRSVAHASLLSWLRPPFTLRPALAASFALLVIFAAGWFLLARSRQSNGAALASLEKSMGDFELNEMKEADTTAIRRTKTTSRNAVERSARRTLPLKEIEASAPRSVGTSNSAPPPQAIARMEIQTSDPNIRIIWLARKSAE